MNHNAFYTMPQKTANQNTAKPLYVQWYFIPTFLLCAHMCHIDCVVYCIVQGQKISILPPQKELEFPGGGGFCNTKKFKMCEALFEFPEGWGSQKKSLLWGKHSYFLELHIFYGCWHGINSYHSHDILWKISLVSCILR